MVSKGEKWRERERGNRLSDSPILSFCNSFPSLSPVTTHNRASHHSQIVRESEKKPEHYENEEQARAEQSTSEERSNYLAAAALHSAAIKAPVVEREGTRKEDEKNDGHFCNIPALENESPSLCVRTAVNILPFLIFSLPLPSLIMFDQESNSNHHRHHGHCHHHHPPPPHFPPHSAL